MRGFLKIYIFKIWIVMNHRFLKFKGYNKKLTSSANQNFVTSCFDCTVLKKGIAPLAR